MFKKMILFCITAYQRTISPDHGSAPPTGPLGRCRFYPSCSEYTRRAVERDGVFRGVQKGLYRVLRCNPWNNGGIDEP